jgi:DNA replication and repair protein RecF
MITDLHLQHFRSYSDAAFEFDPGVNIIVGPNASGKTNLLEALLFIAIGKPYRGSTSESIQFTKPWSRLEAHTLKGERVVKLETIATGTRKQFQAGGQSYARLFLNKTLPVVLFEPEHLQLLNGQPERRRAYLDDTLEQTIVGFGRLRRDYKRALSQRNRLLKLGPRTASQLFAWNVRLSELGSQIVKHRQDLTNEINQSIANLYRQLTASRANVSIEYMPSCISANYGSDLLQKLEQHTDLDYARGFTAYGPHRDDLMILLKGHNAHMAASRGETRSLLLALKILEVKRLEALRGQKPVLLLDDVFSELDGSRRKALTAFLRDYQTFITTTDADIVTHHFSEGTNIIPLNK